MNVPTAHSTKSIEEFLLHITNSPLPRDDINTEYLKEHGFKSGNDPELRHIFRLLGLLDDLYKPTEKWQDYKKNGQGVLKTLVLNFYKELFELFPDAPNRTDKELESWFHPPLTGETKSSIERAIRTFRKLCQFAAITADNRIKPPSEESGAKTVNQLPQLPNRGFQLVVQPRPHGDKSEYLRLFEAIKEVFYK